MNEVPPNSNALNLWERAGLAALATALSLALAAAVGLEPDGRGYGTHEQLGFPACTFFRMVGRPCPSCGMTTAWANALHGRPLAALQANAAGALLAAAAPLVVVWVGVSAAKGIWWGGRPRPQWLLAAAGLLTAVVLIDWVRRLTGGWN
ncbi:MAG: DUF2752 domain-containing protein [Pirellulales bacterium]